MFNQEKNTLYSTLSNASAIIMVEMTVILRGFATLKEETLMVRNLLFLIYNIMAHSAEKTWPFVFLGENKSS